MSGMPGFSPRTLRLVAAGLVVINGFFPALWILLTSLKTEAELVSKPITWWPAAPTFGNYLQAFTEQPLLRYLGNSFVVAGGATVASLVVSGLAAYAIARLNLRRRQRRLQRLHPARRGPRALGAPRQCSFARSLPSGNRHLLAT